MGDIPNTHIRDYQRKRVYKAEDSCLFWGDTQIMTREQVEDVVYKISQWAEIKPPKITEDGHEITYATKDKISFTYPALKTLPYICHEMSHVILYNWKHVKNDYHGPNFCYIYLELIAWVLGRDTRNKLRKLFIKNGVQISNNLV